MKRIFNVFFVLMLVVSLMLVPAVSAYAQQPPFSATINITGDLEIAVGETTTLTAEWTTNRDVTRYKWKVDETSQGVVPMEGASSGDSTFGFSSDTAGSFEITFQILHHVQTDRDASECITVTVTSSDYEGLSHGFWKNHTGDWPEDYELEDTLGTIFDLSIFPALTDVWLLDALSFNGGPNVDDAAQLLLVQAVAAMLNAADTNINYPLTSEQIISQVNEALNSGDRATILDLKDDLDDYNNLSES